ncbi:hypothetical protein PI125_g16930 [Phytophthora idaei]|nr:hypothetical protein PI125_g16930 [Phytophthora idaei]
MFPLLCSCFRVVLESALKLVPPVLRYGGRFAVCTGGLTLLGSVSADAFSRPMAY